MFRKQTERTVSQQKKEVLKNETGICAGKFGRINKMIKATPAKRKKAMIEYAEELVAAEKLFKIY